MKNNVNVPSKSNNFFIIFFTLQTSQPCLDGVPLAEEDGSGGDQDERVGAGSEAVLELHVAVHEGQRQPLVSGLAGRVHQQALTVQTIVHRAFLASKGIFNKK